MISADGFPARISASICGMITRLGTGRVWSEAITTIFRFPATSSRRRGDPMGCAIAVRTSSSPDMGGLYPCMPERSTPARCPSSISTATVSRPYGRMIFSDVIMSIPFLSCCIQHVMDIVAFMVLCLNCRRIEQERFSP